MSEQTVSTNDAGTPANDASASTPAGTPARRRRTRQSTPANAGTPARRTRQSTPASTPASVKAPSTNALRSVAMNAMILQCAEAIATDAAFKRVKSALKRVSPASEHAAIDALTRDACSKFFAERLSYASSATRYDKRLAPQTRMNTRKLISVA